MPPKRAGGRAPTSSHSEGSSFSTPLANALIVALALGYGLYLLHVRGTVTWPPPHLLASLYTVAGCLALVGPVVLSRVESGERGLGELLWMTGGLLIWVFDAVAMFRGTWRVQAWATPLGPHGMGMTMLAGGLAGWGCRPGGRHLWWGTGAGWTLGVFWGAMGAPP